MTFSSVVFMQCIDKYLNNTTYYTRGIFKTFKKQYRKDFGIDS